MILEGIYRKSPLTKTLKKSYELNIFHHVARFKKDFSLRVRGGSLPDHDGPDADPEHSIKSLESFPSVALHSAHHKPTMECYGKSNGELPIKY